MSIKAMSWAFGLNLKPTRKVVLLALADSADDDGRCWPGSDHLAEKTSVCSKTVQRTITQLEKLGLLTKTNRRRGKENLTNLYQLHLETSVVPKTKTPDEGAENNCDSMDKLSPPDTDLDTDSTIDKLSPPMDTAKSPPMDTTESIGYGHSYVQGTVINHQEPITHTERVEDFDARFAEQPEHQQAPEPIQPIQRVARGRWFPMSADWQPDQTFTDQAFTLGLDLNNLTEDQGEQVNYALEEFRTWWVESRPNEINTQRLWQQKFIQTSLKREFNKNNRSSHHGNGHQQNPGNRQQSSITQPYTEADFNLDATW